MVRSLADRTFQLRSARLRLPQVGRARAARQPDDPSPPEDGAQSRAGGRFAGGVGRPLG